MSEPLFLWVTRTAPDNMRTAHRLRAMGHNVFTQPVLTIRPVDLPGDVGDPDAIAFTSAHGLRHHPFRQAWTNLPIFTVGDRTAEAARRLGYVDVRSAGGDVEALQELIVATLPKGAHVIHFSAREPAGNLCRYLQLSGHPASKHIVYEAIPAEGADLERAAAMLPLIDGAIIQSSKAARCIADMVDQARWYGMVFCLSENCAAEFRGLPGLLVETAAEPTEDALMALLRAYRSKRPRGIRLQPLETIVRT